MNFSRRQRQEVDVNLTPLIDVVFLLLIFFMVSTTFTKESQLSIDLPEASTKASRVAKKKIEISITRQGEYAVNGVSLLNRKPETLKSAISKISEGDNTLPMVITADSATAHQSVVTAMDMAGQLGFIQFSITTQTTTPTQ